MESTKATTTLLATLIASLCASSALAQEQGKPAAGDLGLEEVEHPASGGPRDSSKAGIGINATLSPTPVVNIGGAGLVGPLTVTSFISNISLRLWLEHLMIEPILGLGLVTGDNFRTEFLLNAGVLGGYALKTGNLRPFVGGGFTFAILSANDTTRGSISFGPLFGLEYRFNELPQLGFDAALFVPFHMEFNPFIFAFGTGGGVILGFHYYFSS
jgi:hypothetical protein